MANVTTRDALLRAVLASPDDDLPKLVYADWLDENGESGTADLIRVPSPVREELYGRTKSGRRWRKLADWWLKGVIPRSWTVWPIQDTEADPSWGDRGRDGNWASACGSCHFSCSGVPFVVCFRHGFIDAVAATTRRLYQVLPAVLRVQPVRRVAVIGEFYENADDLTIPAVRFDQLNPRRRAVRRGVNRIPEAVWPHLAGPEMPCASWVGRQEVMKVFPDVEAAHRAVGDAFLAWAEEENAE